VVNAVLERLYRENEVVFRDGRRRPLSPPAIAPARGDYLFRLIRERRPSVTLEVGFAFGVSTLFIAEALRQNGHGRHIVIDPLEHTKFDGLGLRHLDEAGLTQLVDFREEPAELCLPRLVADGVRVDLAFDDSGHLFDHVVTEFVFLARLLRAGGVLVFDDAGLPGVARACDFIATNRRDFAEVVAPATTGLLRSLLGKRPIPPPPHGTHGRPSMRTFQKVTETDERNWNEFVPF
jgi:predicted O-methyltransferase YrrM